jgi:N-acetylglucosamine-6-sulfatase
VIVGVSGKGFRGWSLLALLIVPAAFLCGATGASAASAERPNIVVIETDDQIVSDLDYMPTVRRQIIERGTTFENFFNSYPLCCPSRTAFLTGQFAHNHHVESNFESNEGGYYQFSSLPGKLNQRNSLGAWMQDAGYRTGLVGKYLNEYGAKDRTEVPPGWDRWAALLDNSTYDYFNYAMNIDGKVRFWGDRDYAEAQLNLAAFSNADPPESFQELLALFKEVFVPYDYFGTAKPSDYSMDTNGRYAADFVEDSAPRKKPFFLWYTPPAPHAEDTNHAQGLRPGAPEPDPRPPYRYRHAFDDVEVPKSPAFNEDDVSDKAANVRDLPKLTDAQVSEIGDNYRGRLGAVLSVDDQVKRIIRQLRRAGELRNTYIVYTSDNGYMQGDHRLRSSKFLPYEPGIRLPAVVRGPGVERGAEVGGNAIDVDWTATILDMAGAKPGRTMDGLSLLPAAEGRKSLPDRDVPLEALKPLFKFYTPITAFDLPYYGVRTDRYKFIQWSFDERELYDLKKDPYELENLAGKPRYAELEAKLAARASELSDCAGAECR